MATIFMLAPFSQIKGYWWFGIDFTTIVTRFYDLSFTHLFAKQFVPCCTTKYIIILSPIIYYT